MGNFYMVKFRSQQFQQQNQRPAPETEKGLPEPTNDEIKKNQIYQNQKNHKPQI